MHIEITFAAGLFLIPVLSIVLVTVVGAVAITATRDSEKMIIQVYGMNKTVEDNRAEGVGGGIDFISTTTAATIISSSSATDVDTKLSITPEKIDIHFPTNFVTTLPRYSLHLLSTTNNLTNIRAHFSDLHSQDDTKLWMHNSILKMDPPLVNLTAGRLTPVDIILTLPNQTGTYTGTMTLASDSAVLKEDIPVIVRSNFIIPIFSLIAVAVGFGVAFIVKYAKLRIKSRDEAVKALEDAEAAAFLARTEKHVDDKYRQGDKEFSDADKFFLIGDYIQAERVFESATKYYNSSKDGGEVDPNKQRPALTPAAMAKKVRAARAIKGLRSSLGNPGNAFFFVASITLAIGVMQTWTQVYSQLSSSLDVTFISIITAFLLGYGSQSLLGEVLELSK